MKDQKILIIQTAFIGDVILATSLVEYVRKLFPEAQIDFFLRKGNESIMSTNPNINQLYIWDKNKNKFSALLKLIFDVRSQKYDTVINIQRFFNSGLVTALSKARTKVGFKQNPLSLFFTHKVNHQIPHKMNSSYFHEVQRNAQLIIPLINNAPIPPASALRPMLYFSPEDEMKIYDLKLPAEYFVLAPSSVWYTKQWHESKWKELIQRLSAKAKVYLIGAPTDNAYIERLYVQTNSQVINLCGGLSLRQSALLMKNALRVFVNDSAPLHLASSVNAKTTAIFCSTVAEFGYFPLSEQQQLIQLEPRLDCMPCGLHGHKQCPHKHFKCAMDISVDIVEKTI